MLEIDIDFFKGEENMWKYKLFVLVLFLFGLLLFIVMFVLAVGKGNFLFFDRVLIIVYWGVLGYVLEYMIFFYEIV